MPDWIIASLMFFGLVLGAVVLSAAIIAGVGAGFPGLTAAVVGIAVVVGVPALFYVVLR